MQTLVVNNSYRALTFAQSSPYIENLSVYLFDVASLFRLPIVHCVGYVRPEGQLEQA